MKKILTLLALFLLLSCSSNRIVTTKNSNSNYKSTVVKPNTSSVTKITPIVNKVPTQMTDKVAIYIHKYKSIAQYEMQQTGIPASITLAQGILESGAGQGDLTQRANNHFGIKCHDWNGDKVYHDDDRKGECFRKYDHPSESFKDHSKFLTSRSRYDFLFKLDEKDYKGWAKGLREAGYATDSKYPTKLISLIERYDLYNYDDLSTEEIINKNISTSKNSYTVQKGETLYSIASKFNLSVSKLMKLNKLETSALDIGQQLIVK